MSGVWVFSKKGVARLISNPTRESFEQNATPSRPGTATAPGARPRILVYLPTNQHIGSHSELELCLAELGWSRYINHDVSLDLVQFHRSDDAMDLLSFPRDFKSMKAAHMYDVVVKNRSYFEVRRV